jgi:hypothetical protein
MMNTSIGRGGAARASTCLMWNLLICTMLGSAVAAVSLIAAQAKPPLTTPAEAKVLADFDARVKAYYELRDKVDEGKARQTQTKEPEKVEAQRKALATSIQKARAGAKPGDIFTPEVQPFIKRWLKPALKGTDGKDNKNTLKEENPSVELKVNAPYPEKQPLSTMPPDVLLQLPKLPKDLEYRFIQKHLLLYDSRASLIVDFVYNAIP